MTSQPQSPNETAAAPVLPVPTAPPAGGPVWPEVIGVLSIVIGGERLVSAAGGMIGSLVGQVLKGTMPNLPRLGSFAWQLAVVHGTRNLACMLLVAAGVLLLRRRRVTVPLHWMAAAGTLIAQVLLLGFYVRLFPFRTAPEPSWTRMLPASVSGTVQLGYPVFAVVWFLRGSVRRQMRSWRSGQGRRAARHVGIAWPAVLAALVIVNAGQGLLLWAASLPVGLSRWFWTQETGLHAVAFGMYMLDPPMWVLAIIGAWLLGRRRRAGVACLLIYAGVRLIPSLSLPVLAAVTTAPRQHLWKVLPSSIVTAILWAALPVFLLIWLSRPKVRWQVRSWRTGRRRAPGKV